MNNLWEFFKNSLGGSSTQIDIFIIEFADNGVGITENAFDSHFQDFQMNFRKMLLTALKEVSQPSNQSISIKTFYAMGN